MRFNVPKSTLLGWAAAAVASSWMTAPTLAMMANPNPIQLKQADGSTFTARMHGNEVYHDVTDMDGESPARMDVFCVAKSIVSPPLLAMSVTGG